MRQNYQTKAKTQNIRKAFESAKKSHNYVKGLKSMFDFNGMVALAGLWVVWNSFLVGIGKIFKVSNTVVLSCGSERKKEPGI